jgi:hypothetical protein
MGRNPIMPPPGPAVPGAKNAKLVAKLIPTVHPLPTPGPQKPAACQGTGQPAFSRLPEKFVSGNGLGRDPGRCLCPASFRPDIARYDPVRAELLTENPVPRPLTGLLTQLPSASCSTRPYPRTRIRKLDLIGRCMRPELPPPGFAAKIPG